MPDLTLESRRVCASNEHWEADIPASIAGGKYHVSYHKGNPGPYLINWHCTCAGFQFRQRCRHIDIAKTQICQAGRDAYAGGPGIEDSESCPKCGGPFMYIQIGV